MIAGSPHDGSALIRQGLRLLEYALFQEIIRLLGFPALVQGWPAWRGQIRSEGRKRSLFSDLSISIHLRGNPSSIQRALNAMRTTVEHMGIYLRRFDVLVAKQFLDSADIIASFEQMGGETV